MAKRPAKKSETLEVRLSYEAKTAFMAACEQRGLSASEAVRAFVETYPGRGSRRSVTPVSKELKMILAKLSLPLKAAGAAAAAAVGSLALGAAPSAADPDRAAQFANLDADGNGRVTLAELYVSAGYDADGSVSDAFVAEMVSIAAAAANASHPGLFTEEGLEKLVADEVRPSLENASDTVRDVFEDHDLDSDGVWTLNEYLKADQGNDWRGRRD